MSAGLPRMTPCGACGMPCDPAEYHPFAACLMFQACHSSETVRANLEAIRQEAARQAMEQLKQKARQIDSILLDGDDVARWIDSALTHESEKRHG